MVKALLSKGLDTSILSTICSLIKLTQGAFTADTNSTQGSGKGLLVSSSNGEKRFTPFDCASKYLE